MKSHLDQIFETSVQNQLTNESISESYKLRILRMDNEVLGSPSRFAEIIF